MTKLRVSRKDILNSKTWEIKVNDIKTQQTAYCMYQLMVINLLLLCSTRSHSHPLFSYSLIVFEHFKSFPLYRTKKRLVEREIIISGEKISPKRVRYECTPNICQKQYMHILRSEKLMKYFFSCKTSTVAF